MGMVPSGHNRYWHQDSFFQLIHLFQKMGVNIPVLKLFIFTPFYKSQW